MWKIISDILHISHILHILHISTFHYAFLAFENGFFPLFFPFYLYCIIFTRQNAVLWGDHL